MKRLLIALACAACAGLVSAQEAPKAAAPAPEAKAAADSAAKPHNRRAPRARDAMRRGARVMRGRAVEAKPFGKLADGTEVKIYRLQSPDGLIIDVSDYGGRLVRCYAPDKYGNLADVTLGWNTPGEYEKLGFSMGTLIGRYGNRIADGKFTLDGKEYQLPINEDKKTAATQRHCNLHGGPEGWDKKVWTATPMVSRAGHRILLRLRGRRDGLPRQGDLPRDLQGDAEQRLVG